MTVNWNKIPLHPYAFEGNKSSFDGIRAGSVAYYYPSNVLCRVDEFTHDGDAFVVFATGIYSTVKANMLQKVQG